MKIILLLQNYLEISEQLGRIKNIYTLIKEILEELNIETYFDFYITFNQKIKYLLDIS